MARFKPEFGFNVVTAGVSLKLVPTAGGHTVVVGKFPNLVAAHWHCQSSLIMCPHCGAEILDTWDDECQECLGGLFTEDPTTEMK